MYLWSVGQETTTLLYCGRVCPEATEDSNKLNAGVEASYSTYVLMQLFDPDETASATEQG